MPFEAELRMSPPGAATSTLVPKLEKYERPPERFTEATVTTPEQFAGASCEALWFSLPAATMTLAPRERAELMAFCVVVSQEPMPPSEMLTTLAGLAFAGTPETVPPVTQMIASAISEV